MAHSFDTGLAKAQRTLIREAVLARLGRLLKSANPARYVAIVKPLARPVRGEGDGDALAMIQHAIGGQAPAILVALGRKRCSTNVDPLEARGSIDLHIYAVSTHRRDMVDGRLAIDVVGTADLTADPGIETMLEHIEESLLGQSLELDGVAEPRPTEEDEVGTFEEFTVWEQRYTVDVNRTINPLRDVAEVVTSIEADHQEDGIPDGTLDLGPLVTIANLEPEEP